MLKAQIEQDLKAALLAGDKERATTLRSLKSAILYVEVAHGLREQGLDDAAVTDVLAKEAKKRQESADMYQKGGDEARAQAELAEKQLIEGYLPQQLTEEELQQIVDDVIGGSGVSDPRAIGQVIGQVKQKTAGRADGAKIAAVVKERLKNS